MLLSIIDPDLLVYERKHWESDFQQFIERLNTLILHRRFIRAHHQNIAITFELAAIVYEVFPWSSSYRDFPELRDLRLFMTQDLNRVQYVDSVPSQQVSPSPDGLTCRYVASSSILNAWRSLLGGCAKEQANSEKDFVVATWIALGNTIDTPFLDVTLSGDIESETHSFLVAWDEGSWANCLASQSPWPDLKECVDLYYLTQPAIRNLPGVKDTPTDFICTDDFWKSVERFCKPNMRQALIKAIAKKVYGVLDAGLHDEPLSGGIRRLRVTEFWRIHYTYNQSVIVFQEFGEHNMGL